MCRPDLWGMSSGALGQQVVTIRESGILLWAAKGRAGERAGLNFWASKGSLEAFQSCQQLHIICKSIFVVVTHMQGSLVSTPYQRVVQIQEFFCYSLPELLCCTALQ